MTIRGNLGMGHNATMGNDATSITLLSKPASFQEYGPLTTSAAVVFLNIYGLKSRPGSHGPVPVTTVSIVPARKLHQRKIKIVEGAHIMLKKIAILLGMAAMIAWPGSHAMAQPKTESNGAMSALIASTSPDSIRSLDTKDVIDALLIDGTKMEASYDSLQTNFESLTKIKDDEARRTETAIYKTEMQTLRDKLSEEMDELRFLRSMSQSETAASAGEVRAQPAKVTKGDATGH